jgi:hypothetical protein
MCDSRESSMPTRSSDIGFSSSTEIITGGETDGFGTGKHFMSIAAR